LIQAKCQRCNSRLISIYCNGHQDSTVTSESAAKVELTICTASAPKTHNHTKTSSRSLYRMGYLGAYIYFQSLHQSIKNAQKHVLGRDCPFPIWRQAPKPPFSLHSSAEHQSLWNLESVVSDEGSVADIMQAPGWLGSIRWWLTYHRYRRRRKCVYGTDVAVVYLVET